MIRTLTLTSLVLTAGLAVAQPPVQTEKATSPFGGGITTKLKSAKKSSLETSIDLALANNPDLRVAEAKVREAEASLSRTRLQVLQKVVAAYHALDVARAAVKQAEAYMERVTKLGAAGAISQAEVDKATAALAAAKSALAAAQAELDYLQGKVTTKGVTWTTPTFSTRYDPVLTEATLREDWRSRTRQDLFVEKFPHGASADRLREALKTKLSLSVTEVPAKDLLDQLRRKAPDVHIQISPRMSWEGGTITAKLSDVPLSAALQLLEDVLGDCKIVVRDYGLFVGPRAQTPARATSLADFLRDAPTTTETKPKSK